jgi:hypothetical protein
MSAASQHNQPVFALVAAHGWTLLCTAADVALPLAHHGAKVEVRCLETASTHVLGVASGAVYVGSTVAMTCLEANAWERRLFNIQASLDAFEGEAIQLRADLGKTQRDIERADLDLRNYLQQHGDTPNYTNEQVLLQQRNLVLLREEKAALREKEAYLRRRTDELIQQKEALLAEGAHRHEQEKQFVTDALRNKKHLDDAAEAFHTPLYSLIGYRGGVQTVIDAAQSVWGRRARSGNKEDFPLHVLVAPPGQGKTEYGRQLIRCAKHAPEDGMPYVPILVSFNQDTTWVAERDSGAISKSFWRRVRTAFGKPFDETDFWYPNLVDVPRFLHSCLRDAGMSPCGLLLFVDEVAKVSDFDRTAMLNVLSAAEQHSAAAREPTFVIVTSLTFSVVGDVVCTGSNRPIRPVQLPVIDEAEITAVVNNIYKRFLTWLTRIYHPSEMKRIESNRLLLGAIEYYVNHCGHHFRTLEGAMLQIVQCFIPGDSWGQLSDEFFNLEPIRSLKARRSLSDCLTSLTKPGPRPMVQFPGVSDVMAQRVSNLFMTDLLVEEVRLADGNDEEKWHEEQLWFEELNKGALFVRRRKELSDGYRIRFSPSLPALFAFWKRFVATDVVGESVVGIALKEVVHCLEQSNDLQNIFESIVPLVLFLRYAALRQQQREGIIRFDRLLPGCRLIADGRDETTDGLNFAVDKTVIYRTDAHQSLVHRATRLRKGHADDFARHIVSEARPNVFCVQQNEKEHSQCIEAAGPRCASSALLLWSMKLRIPSSTELRSVVSLQQTCNRMLAATSPSPSPVTAGAPAPPPHVTAFVILNNVEEWTLDATSGLQNVLLIGKRTIDTILKPFGASYLTSSIASKAPSEESPPYVGVANAPSGQPSQDDRAGESD